MSTPTFTDAAAASSSIADPLATGGQLPTDTLGGGVPPAQTSMTPDAGNDQWNSLSAYLNEQAANRLARTQASQNTNPSIPAGANGGATGTGLKIIKAAEHLLGTMYAWGGNGPGGVDCSGLVRYAYAAAGIQLPRISYQQANAGSRVTIKALRPGDLVAWDNSSRNPGADHIAIYIGRGMIIEAARPGTAVRIRKLGGNEGAWGVRMGW